MTNDYDTLDEIRDALMRVIDEMEYLKDLFAGEIYSEEPVRQEITNKLEDLKAHVEMLMDTNCEEE